MTEKWTCDKCGKEEFFPDTCAVNEGYAPDHDPVESLELCEDCAAEHTVECQFCGESVPFLDAGHTDHGPFTKYHHDACFDAYCRETREEDESA